MSEIKHTPGPFYAESGNLNHFTVFADGGQALARLFDKRGPFPQSHIAGNQYLYDGQAEANALLFAAAPDLLASLEGLIEHAQPDNWDDGEDPDQAQAWRNAFRAMCKAKGLRDPFPEASA